MNRKDIIKFLDDQEMEINHYKKICERLDMKLRGVDSNQSNFTSQEELPELNKETYSSAEINAAIRNTYLYKGMGEFLTIETLKTFLEFLNKTHNN